MRLLASSASQFYPENIPFPVINSFIHKDSVLFVWELVISPVVLHCKEIHAMIIPTKLNFFLITVFSVCLGMSVYSQDRRIPQWENSYKIEYTDPKDLRRRLPNMKISDVVDHFILY